MNELAVKDNIKIEDLIYEIRRKTSNARFWFSYAL